MITQDTDRRNTIKLGNYLFITFRHHKFNIASNIHIIYTVEMHESLLQSNWCQLDATEKIRPSMHTLFSNNITFAKTDIYPGALHGHALRDF